MKVKGQWMYFYRAVDKHGKTLDFMLSEHRDKAAATDVFARTIENRIPVSSTRLSRQHAGQHEP